MLRQRSAPDPPVMQEYVIGMLAGSERATADECSGA